MNKVANNFSPLPKLSKHALEKSPSTNPKTLAIVLGISAMVVSVAFQIDGDGGLSEKNPAFFFSSAIAQ